MSILFIGNEQQAFFSCVRLLRDRGVDAHLLLLQDAATYDHPSHDAFGLEYQRFTRNAPWGDRGLFSATNPRAIRKYVAPHVFTIGTGTAPAFLLRAGIALDVFVPSGADLLSYPHLQLVSPRRAAVRSIFEFPNMQARGIANARIYGGPYSTANETALAQLGAGGKRLYFPIAPIYVPDTDRIERYFSRSNVYEDFRAIRAAADLVVFCRLRHECNASGVLSSAALLEGMAMAKKQLPALRLATVLFDHGVDVQRAHALVKSLSLESDTHFFPRLSRKETLIGISQCDIVYGEAEGGLNSAAAEGIALQKTVMQPRVGDTFEHMNAHDAKSVAQGICDFANAPATHKATAAKNHAWFHSAIVARSIDAFETLIRGRT
jgi:hypothetical protein